MWGSAERLLCSHCLSPQRMIITSRSTPSTAHHLQKWFSALQNEIVGVSSPTLIYWGKATCLALRRIKTPGANWMALPASSKGTARVHGKITSFVIYYNHPWVVSHSMGNFDFSVFSSTLGSLDSFKGLASGGKNTLSNLYIDFLAFFCKPNHLPSGWQVK